MSYRRAEQQVLDVCGVLSDYGNVGSFLLSTLQWGIHCGKPPPEHEPLRYDYQILRCWLCYFSPYISFAFLFSHWMCALSSF